MEQQKNFNTVIIFGKFLFFSYIIYISYVNKKKGYKTFLTICRTLRTRVFQVMCYKGDGFGLRGVWLVLKSQRKNCWP